MSVQSLMDIVIGDREAVRDVRLMRDAGEDIIAVRLHFDRATIFLIANLDDDTVTISVDEPGVPEGARWTTATDSLLAVVGRRVQWHWGLCNNNGYWDGVQFEFVRDVAGDVPICLQMIAIASKLSIRDVVRLE
jgi:hypothetical protein